jgi:nickel superoxide dismutase
MSLLACGFAPRATAFAHCDLPCGVYDPAQARIEAESVKAICEKYQQNSDAEFRARAIDIKLACAAGTKGSTDPATADALLAKIEDISKIFWETKQG